MFKYAHKIVYFLLAIKLLLVQYGPVQNNLRKSKFQPARLPHSEANKHGGYQLTFTILLLLDTTAAFHNHLTKIENRLNAQLRMAF